MRCSAFIVALMMLGIGYQPVRSEPIIYYVSDRAHADVDNPGTREQPWSGLGRVRAELPRLQPGDQVLFERGGVYPGYLYGDGLRGTREQPIRFGAYGAGAPPVWSAAARLTTWENIGTNTWQTFCGDCELGVNGLIIDGDMQPLARFPNADQGDGGYLYFDSAPNRTTLIDDALIGDIDWTGGELVVRSIAWVLDRLPIAAHSGDRLTTTTPTSYDPEIGYGYFIQNHRAALDRDGEWVHDARTQTFTLYWSGDPNTHEIYATARNTLVDFVRAGHVEFSDIILYGADEYALILNQCSHITLRNITITHGARDGLIAQSCQHLTVSDSRIAHHWNNALAIDGCERCRVDHNVIEYIALAAGMGQSGDGQYFAVRIEGDSATTFEHNRVQDVGYIGVGFGGDVLVGANIVRRFTQVKVDGSGIYTYRNRGGRVTDNLVMDGMGSLAGTPLDTRSTHGIYIDDNSEGVEVRGNGIARMAAGGIYLHNTRDVQVTHNIILGAGESALILTDDELGSYNVENTIIRDNVLIALAPESSAMTVISERTRDLPATFGSSDHNLICHVTSDTPFRQRIFSDALPAPEREFYTLDEWRAAWGLEMSSVTCR
jgi:hypothetical protein